MNELKFLDKVEDKNFMNVEDVKSFLIKRVNEQDWFDVEIISNALAESFPPADYYYKAKESTSFRLIPIHNLRDYENIVDMYIG